MNPATTSPPGPIVYSQNIPQGHGRDGHYVSGHGESSSNNAISDHAASSRYQLRHPASAPPEPQRPRIPSSVEAYAVRPPPPLQHPFPHSGPSGSQASPTVESPQTYQHRHFPAHLHSPPTSASPPFPPSPSLHFHYDANHRPPPPNQSRGSPVVPSHPPQPPPSHSQSHARRSSYGPSQPQHPPDHHPPLRRSSVSGGTMPPPNSAGNGIPTPPPSAPQRSHQPTRSNSQPHPQPPSHQQNSHPPQPPHHHAQSQPPRHTQSQSPHHAQTQPPHHVQSQSPHHRDVQSQPPQQPPQPTHVPSQSQPLPSPHPHSQPPLPPADPLVLASAEAALAPMRAHLENAWKAATTNVHLAMEKMHNDFTSLATKERQKGFHLKQSVAHLEAKLRASEDHLDGFKSAAQELEALRRDYGELEDDNVTQRRKNAELMRRIEELEAANADLVKEIAEVKEENGGLKDGLQSAAHIMAGYKSEFAKLHSEKVDRRALSNGSKDNDLNKDGHDGIAVMDYMSTVLSAVTDQVSRQMESKMNTVLSEIQEQRMAAEQRSMEVLKQLQGARRSSSELSPVIQQDTLVSNGPEPAAQTPPQPRRASRHELPRMITMTQGAQRPSPSSPLISPQILAKAAPVTRICTPSGSSTTTPIEKSTPLQRKRSLPIDIHHADIPSRTSSVGSPLADPKHVRVSSLPNPELPSSIMNRAPPSPPARKKSRMEYELDEPRIDHSPEPPSTRQSSTPVSVKTEAVPQHVINPPPTPMDVDPPPPPPRPIPSLPSPTTPIKEEGEIPELEEGEVVPDPVPVQEQQQQPKPPRSLPPRVHKPFKLGINHIDLLYSNENGSLVCQMCLTRRQEAASASDRRCHVKASVQRFPDDASWSDLIGHCRDEHPSACHDLEKLKPSQIAEMKQRMRSGTRHGR